MGRIVFSRNMSVLLSFLLLELTAGCTSRIEQVSPALPEIPAEWAYADRSTFPLERGFFEDKALQKVLQAAIQGSYSLQVMAVKIQRADALYTASTGERYPLVTVGVDASKEGYSRDEGSGKSFENKKFEPYGLVSWEVDFWGKIRDRAAASENEYQATIYDYQAARLSLGIKLTKAWYRSITAKLLLRQAAQIAESYRMTLEVVEERYLAGLSEALEVYMAQTALSQSLLMLEARRSEFERSVQYVQVLSGDYPDASLQVPDDLPAEIPEIPVGVPADMVMGRPDLKAARMRIESADRMWSAAMKEMLPTITLSARGGWSSSSLRESFDPAHGLWQLAAGLTQPVFQGRRLLKQAEEAEYTVHQQQLEYCELLLNAFLEVEESLISVQSLAKQLSQAEKTADYAARSWNAAIEQYRLGAVDLLTVLLNQRQHLQSRVELIELQNQLLQSSIDLALALGNDSYFMSQYRSD